MAGLDGSKSFRVDRLKAKFCRPIRRVRWVNFLGRSVLDARERFNGSPENGVFPLEALVLYCARHTYATDALARTGNVAAVMDTMGHANVQTTMIYQHQGLEQIRGAINLRNQENQRSTIKSHGTETIFGQNPGQSIASEAVAVASSD